MKKSSLETLLLLSNIQNKSQLAQFCKDIKALDSDVLSGLLTSLETTKQVTYAATIATFETQLERHNSEREKQRAEAETQRNEREEIKRSTDEILHLLLKRSKLKVPAAATALSSQLSQKGYRALYDGEPTKAGFTKWIKELCEQYPKREIVNAAVDLSAKYS